MEKRCANRQICHAPASATRVNQGVEPWVSQRPLAKLVGICSNRVVSDTGNLTVSRESETGPFSLAPMYSNP